MSPEPINHESENRRVDRPDPIDERPGGSLNNLRAELDAIPGAAEIFGDLTGQRPSHGRREEMHALIAEHERLGRAFRAYHDSLHVALAAQRLCDAEFGPGVAFAVVRDNMFTDFDRQHLVFRHVSVQLNQPDLPEQFNVGARQIMVHDESSQTKIIPSSVLVEAIQQALLDRDSV